MFYIQSNRLKLIPLNHELLNLWKTNRIEMLKTLGLKTELWQMDDFYQAEVDDALENAWLPKTAEYPDEYRWFTNWEIILLEENISIGGIGFFGSPKTDGTTIVGYGLDKRYHGQGFASEALTCLCNWGFQQADLQIIIATTPLDNYPSHKVLQRNHFQESKREEDLIYWELRKIEV